MGGVTVRDVDVSAPLADSRTPKPPSRNEGARKHGGTYLEQPAALGKLENNAD